MATRPNPTQHTAADEREWREYARLRAPDGLALDERDLALAFAETSQRSLARAIRKAALDWVLENMPDRFIVRPGFGEELVAYVEGRGDYPDDAKAITSEEQLARRTKRAVEGTGLVDVGVRTMNVSGRPSEELRAETSARAHEGGPDAEGRYPGNEPRGRFARSDDPSFEPDSR